MRTEHFTAFDTALKAAVPELASKTYDSDAPLDGSGAVLKATYLVEHDMGFDSQSDGRLSGEVSDIADGTYRVMVRVVAIKPPGVRDVADAVKSRLVGVVLDIPDRLCGAIQKDPGPGGIQRDTNVSPPLYFLDLDFIWRSQRV